MMVAKIGDSIRAYDFKPMIGRADCFVEGTVENDNCTEPGYNCYKITVTKDFYGDEGSLPKGEHSRVGRIVFVPHRVSFMEYAGRIINLSN